MVTIASAGTVTTTVVRFYYANASVTMDQDWKSLRESLVQELSNVRRDQPPALRDETEYHRKGGEAQALDRVLDMMDEVERKPAVVVNDPLAGVRQYLINCREFADEPDLDALAEIVGGVDE